MTDRTKRDFATRVVHPPVPAATPRGRAGEFPHVAPVFLSSNFQYPSSAAADAAAQGQAFLYGRQSNPGVAGFEAAIAELEGAANAVAFASGMAALSAAVWAVTADKRGSGPVEVLASEGLYGGTHAVLRDVAPGLGVTTRFVPAWNTDAVAAAVGPSTRALVVESISNPLLRVVDLPALATLAQRHKLALIVDGTFTPPCLLRPLAHGATLVVHSVSKYLSGHGDVIAGVVAGNTDDIEAVRRLRTLTGGIMDPFSAWLAGRGLRTLAIRVQRQCENAARMAAHLARHPAVKAVHYPGLPTHPDHQRAGALLPHPGAMVSFDLGDLTAARRFYDRVQVITRAASLGDLASLLTHPASFSHRDLPAAERAAVGITDGLLRLSVGIEDGADLERDIDQALAGAGP